MKHLLKLNESVYYFEQVADDKSKEYVFKNKDNVEFKVFFKPYSSIINDDTWTREYTIKNAKGVSTAYQEINTFDSFNIIKTVTEITNQFLLKYRPKKVIIEHIETYEEMKNRMKTGEQLSKDSATKRAIINSRFLKRDLIPEYSYNLEGHTSTLTRID